MDEPFNILILCDIQPRVAATVRDHIEALENHSAHRWFRLSMLGDIPEKVDLERFDIIVVHYSLVACSEQFLTAYSRKRLFEARALKAIFIQDEYRHVNASVAAMREIGLGVLFTCVPEEEIPKVYSEDALPGVLKVNVLTGYVPAQLLTLDAPPPSQRKLLIGYRGRQLPAWLGDLGQEKYWIGIRFRDDAEKYSDVTCDISFREEDRLYGDAWRKFLTTCRAMLGVESGASVFDFDGEVQRSVDEDVLTEPDLAYEVLKQRHFSDLEGTIKLAQISPRCFESAALRTLMVLYPGVYSNRIVPWRHYIPLEKDHSNMESVIEALRDDELCDRIAEQAYQEVALATENSYQAFAEVVDYALETAFAPHMKAQGPPYTLREFRRSMAFNWMTVRRQWMRLFLTYIHFVVFRVVLGHVRPETRAKIHRRLKSMYYTLTFQK